DRCGSVAPLPEVRNGEKDLERLKGAPVFLPQAIFAALADTPEDGTPQAGRDATHPQGLRGGRDPYRMLPLHERLTFRDKWVAIHAACFDFTVVYRRLPDSPELVEYFLRVSGHAPSP